MNMWKQKCRELFKTETKVFLKWKALKQPSSLLAGFCLFIGIISVLGFREAEDENTVKKLRKIGWQQIENNPCPKILPNHYYEVDYGISNRELYVSSDRTFYISKPSNDEIQDIVRCHEIKQPSHVEEL